MNKHQKIRFLSKSYHKKEKLFEYNILKYGKDKENIIRSNKLKTLEGSP
jgi:hypothetical protein